VPDFLIVFNIIKRGINEVHLPHKEDGIYSLLQAPFLSDMIYLNRLCFDWIFWISSGALPCSFL